jgi:hypothetical protein
VGDSVHTSPTTKVTESESLRIVAGADDARTGSRYLFVSFAGRLGNQMFQVTASPHTVHCHCLCLVHTSCLRPLCLRWPVLLGLPPKRSSR